MSAPGMAVRTVSFCGAADGDALWTKIDCGHGRKGYGIAVMCAVQL